VELTQDGLFARLIEAEEADVLVDLTLGVLLLRSVRAVVLYADVAVVENAAVFS